MRCAIDVVYLARAQHDGGLALRGSIVRSPRDMSFLAAKTIPVDAYKIRNSLYLTVRARCSIVCSSSVVNVYINLLDVIVRIVFCSNLCARLRKRR